MRRAERLSLALWLFVKSLRRVEAKMGQQQYISLVGVDTPLLRQ